MPAGVPLGHRLGSRTRGAARRGAAPASGARRRRCAATRRQDRPVRRAGDLDVLGGQGGRQPRGASGAQQGVAVAGEDQRRDAERAAGCGLRRAPTSSTARAGLDRRDPPGPRRRRRRAPASRGGGIGRGRRSAATASQRRVRARDRRRCPARAARSAPPPRRTRCRAASERHQGARTVTDQDAAAAGSRREHARRRAAVRCRQIAGPAELDAAPPPSRDARGTGHRQPDAAPVPRDPAAGRATRRSARSPREPGSPGASVTPDQRKKPSALRVARGPLSGPRRARSRLRTGLGLRETYVPSVYERESKVACCTTSSSWRPSSSQEPSSSPCSPSSSWP